jgi:hypothetical protein
LDLSPAAIANAVLRLSIPPQSSVNQTWPAERVERLKELLAAGKDYRTIAGELGCSRSAVAGKVDRLGLDRGGAPISTFEERVGWERVVAKGCAWIEGDPKRADWRWCGAPREAGTSWCARHLRRAYGGIPLL